MKKIITIVVLLFMFQAIVLGQDSGRGVGSKPSDAKKKTVLLTFKEIPTAQEREKLAKRGIILESFVSGTSYYATVPVEESGMDMQSQPSGVDDIAMYQEDASYKMKLEESLINDNIPEYAQASNGSVKVIVGLFPSVDFKEVEAYVKTKKLQNVSMTKKLFTLYCDLPKRLIEDLASQVWVKRIECIPPPAEFNNTSGRSMTRANLLSYTGISGRTLDGKGVRVGIWDGNVERHVDLDSRLHTREFIYAQTHGQHVCGTMAGAGVLNPKARGVAPEVDIFAWNFRQGNTAEEMLKCIVQDGIVITQNSYGLPMKSYCKSKRAYDLSASQTDMLVNMFPHVTHVYSGGNSQRECTGKSMYGSVMQRYKNAILVAAIDSEENMSDFSSWGPTDDGRLAPHISVMGVDVLSTVYGNKYEQQDWSGTSMAAPAISGLSALLYQRYGQLHNGEKPLSSLIKGALLNTAKEKGNKGPDYQFGFGVVHGEDAVKVLEREQYFIENVEHKETKQHTIQVPAGTVELKVMLVWVDKYGTAGEKALINDLDLTMTSGNGQTYYPWVLNPEKPNAPAQRKEDHLNNQEQITIENPTAGAYTLEVKGTKLPEGAQQYSLVYSFVKKTLKVDFPNGGDKLEPGDRIVVRWNSSGYKGTTAVELSTDHGISYKTVAKDLKEGVRACAITLPKDVATDKALVRVIQGGTMDVSDASFTILAAPKNLAVKSEACTNEGWLLTWDAVKGAAKYEVLKTDGNGGFDIVGGTTDTRFNLPKFTKEDNIFTVRTVTPSGARSERAFGVIVDHSETLDLATTRLPFSESFAILPSPYIAVNAGKDVNTSFVQLAASQSAPREKGHILQMIGKNASTSDGEYHFESAKKSIVDAKICNVDATKLKGSLWMRLAILVNSAQGDAKVRVLADGEQITNTFNEKEVVENKKGKAIKYYDLSKNVGKKFSLNIQSLVPTMSDTTKITLIQIFQDKKDAAITGIKLPESAESLGNSENITINVRNNTGKEIENVKVNYSINGENIVSETIARPIDPFRGIYYTFSKKANFSTPDKVYKVKAWVELDGDEREYNNQAENVVVNYGDYFRIPAKVSFSAEQKKVGETPLKFTDDGAKVLNYSNKYNGAVVFKPTTADKKIKISFSDIDIADNDQLIILDGEYETSKVLAVLDKDSKAPMEFISSEMRGSLLVMFKSNKQGTAKGWFATVSQTSEDPTGEYGNNFLTLNAINNIHGNYSKDKQPLVNILVKNNTAKAQRNIPVQYRVNGGEWSAEEVIDSIKPGENYEYKFKTAYDFSEQPKAYHIEARILKEDVYMDDNFEDKIIINDKYCVTTSNSQVNKEFVFFTNVESDGVENKTSEVKQGGAYPQYFRNVELPAYKDVDENRITVTINKGYASGNIGLWIDWNNDGAFAEDGETYLPIATQDGENTYTFRYVVPDGVVAGKYSARLKVKTSKSFGGACTSDLYGENSEVEDYTIKVEDKYPHPVDMAVVGTSLSDGLNMTQESVDVTVKNVGVKNIEEFELSYTVDGGELVTEKVKQVILPGAEYNYIFATKADLSKAGIHTINITSAIVEDSHEENNSLSVKIRNQVSSSAGFYALNFDGEDDKVNLGTLNETRINSCTYEAWIKPNSAGKGSYAGFGRIMEGKGTVIFLVGRHKYYQDNSIVVSTGGGSFNTIPNVIKYNNTWQHIAVTIDQDAKQVAVYVNGVKMDEVKNELTKPTAEFKNTTHDPLYLGDRKDGERAFDGMLDEFRIWNTIRTAEQINANMYKHQKGEEGLLAEFSFDEGYFSRKVSSGEFVGEIENAVVSIDKSSIWTDPTVLHENFRFDEQLIDWVVDGDNYYTEVTQDTDLSSLVAKFHRIWRHTTVKVNGVEQESAKTANDFTASHTTPVVYNIDAELFGKNIHKTLNVTIKKEASTACDLLTLELKQPLNYVSNGEIPSTITIATDLEDITAVPTVFTISEGAKLYIGDKEVKSGDEIDYSKPVAIRVLAANSRTENYYTIVVQKGQKIEWSQDFGTKVYGDEPIELTATSSLGAEVVYKSSDDNVVKIVMNKAIIVGVGTAKITAYQQGGNSAQQATPIEKTITVKKKDLIITAEDKEIEYTDAIPELTMFMEGFVGGDNESVLDELPIIETEAKQGSPVGTYPITLVGGVDNNYSYVFKQGTLTIKSVVIETITFKAIFDGTVDAGAKITIAGKTLVTNAEGIAEVKLKAGTYNYAVEKEGREPINGTVTLGDKPVQVEVVLYKELPVYTVTYVIEGNSGDLTGNNVQKIKKGQSGTPVKVVARNGYKFDKWSDGSTEETHIVTNVQADMTIKAFFSKRNYKLVYGAGDGGTIKGITNQTVEFGGVGTSVEVIAKEGYTFVKWSDGVLDNPRIDKDIQGDVSVVAEYARIYKLPYTQTFDEDGIPTGWQSIDNAGDGCKWIAKSEGGYFSKPTIEGSKANHMYMDAYMCGYSGKKDAILVSPLLDMTAFSRVSMKFKHLYKRGYSGEEMATISYSINGGKWVQFENISKSTQETETYEKELSELAGKTNVRFMWRLKDAFYHWVIDDLEVSGVVAADNYDVVYRAGDNGYLEGASAEGTITANVKHAERGPKVKAVAKPGFKFYEWSDGVKDNPREDVVISTLDVTAIFGSDCRAITELPYKEDFDAKETAPDCWEMPKNEHGNHWTITDDSTLGMTGNIAFFNASDIGFEGAKQKVELISPTFDFSDKESVFVMFKMMFFKMKGSAKVVLSYTLDDGQNWSEIKTWIKGMQGIEFYRNNITDLVGRSNVRFRWAYIGGFDFGVAVDEFEVREKPAYVVSYEAEGSYDANDNWTPKGFIKGDAFQEVEEGDDTTPVEAIAETGYKFVEWSDGSKANPRIDVKVSKDLSVIAKFAELKQYSLIYSADTNGMVSGTVSQTVQEGTDGTAVEAIANDGYEFVKWSDGVVDNPRVDTKVAKNIEVKAIFKQIVKYSLVYTADANGTISGTATQTVVEGADGTAVEAVANAGYKFVKWSDGREDNPRVDKNVNANIKVKAIFKLKEKVRYKLHYESNGLGVLRGKTNQTVLEGKSSSPVRAVAYRGYKFVKWSDGREDNPRVEMNVKANVSVTAIFSKLKIYDVSYSTNCGGVIQGYPKQRAYEGGGTRPVTAIPSAGYKFEKWSDGRVDNPRVETNVSGNICVKAIFTKIKQYTLYYQSNGYGVVRGYTYQAVYEGGRGYAVQAVAYRGYEFVKWSDGRVDNPRVDANVTSSVNVVAVFRPSCYNYYGGTRSGEGKGTEEKVYTSIKTSAFISVNADGYNDVWELPELRERLEDGIRNKVQIFSDKGSLVYEKENYMEGEERFAGLDTYDVELKEGTYFYIIQVEGEDDKKGVLHLSRRR